MDSLPAVVRLPRTVWWLTEVFTCVQEYSPVYSTLHLQPSDTVDRATTSKSNTNVCKVCRLNYYPANHKSL